FRVVLAGLAKRLDILFRHGAHSRRCRFGPCERAIRTSRVCSLFPEETSTAARVGQSAQPVWPGALSVAFALSAPPRHAANRPVGTRRGSPSLPNTNKPAAQSPHGRAPPLCH